MFLLTGFTDAIDYPIAHIKTVHWLDFRWEGGVRKCPTHITFLNKKSLENLSFLRSALLHLIGTVCVTDRSKKL